MEHETIYFDRNVMISNHIATIFGTSYPIRAITSVSIRRREMTSGCVPIFAIIIGMPLFLFGTLGIFAYFMDKKESHNDVVILLGIMAIMGLVLAVNGFRTKARPPQFDLIFVTAAGECATLTSKDADYVRHVRAAIEQAILEQ
ncbi:MAG: DUF6232 family protein [Methylocella sp.]